MILQPNNTIINQNKENINQNISNKENIEIKPLVQNQQQQQQKPQTKALQIFEQRFQESQKSIQEKEKIRKQIQIENYQKEQQKISQENDENISLTYNSSLKFKGYPIIDCDQHPYQFTMICANKNCKKQGLICCRCLTSYHGKCMESIFCIDEVMEKCAERLDMEHGKNQDYDQLVIQQQQQVTQIKDFANSVYEIAEKLEKEIKQSAFQINLNAQIKQKQIREIGIVLNEAYEKSQKQKSDSNKENIEHNQNTTINIDEETPLIDIQNFKEKIKNICPHLTVQKKNKKEKQCKEQEVQKNQVELEESDLLKSMQEEDYLNNNYKQPSNQENNDIQQQNNKSISDSDSDSDEECERIVDINIKEYSDYLQKNQKNIEKKQQLFQEQSLKIIKELKQIRYYDQDRFSTWKSGIYQNLNIQEMIYQGWNISYQLPYSHSTNQQELQNIYQNICIDSKSIVCVGVIDQDVDKQNLKLCAIDTAENVFQQTQSTKIAEKSKNCENLYWYNVEDKSFGFSKIETIFLSEGDQKTRQEQEGDFRLSWKLNGDGGYRYGTNIDLYQSKTCLKVILVLI